MLVDGHSIDDTVAVARAIRPDVRASCCRTARGKGNALACGFAAATGDIIVMLDADGSTDPAEIPRFVETLHGRQRLRQGLALRAGRRQRRHHPAAAARQPRAEPARQRAVPDRYSDLCYGYNAFWRHCLPHMHVTCDGFEVETLINVRVARAGLRVTEVPSIEHERLFGESKLHAVRDGLRVLRTIITERLRRSGPVGNPDTWRPIFRELSVARATE